MKTRIERLQSSVFGLRSNVQSPKSKVRTLPSAVSPSPPPHSAFRIPHSKGFTLIELMMVILVILLLSGMLLKIASMVGDKSNRAKATSDIENIQHALNDYMAEYGTYPPVNFTHYMYENTNAQPPSLQYVDIPEDKLYAYGLVSYLYKRDRGGGQYRPYNKDTDRDEAAKNRWAHYLEDVRTRGGNEPETLSSADGTDLYTNSVMTIVDPWNGEYKYESYPPYLSYKLWSQNLE